MKLQNGPCYNYPRDSPPITPLDIFLSIFNSCRYRHVFFKYAHVIYVAVRHMCNMRVCFIMEEMLLRDSM